MASATGQANRIASMISAGQVKCTKWAKVLGTASTSGRSRCVKVLKTRIKTTRTKGRRAQRLRRCGVNSAIWARTAGISGMLFGAEISGVSDSMLKDQRTVISMAASAPAAGKSPLMTLWLQDCAGNKLDPAFAAHELPILYYAKCCFEKWIPIDILESTVDHVKITLADSKNKWNAPSRCPIMSIERLGWMLLSSNLILTDTGMQLDLGCDSPAFVMQQVTEAVRRNIAREVDTQYPTLESRGKEPITSGFRKTLRSAKT